MLTFTLTSNVSCLDSCAQVADRIPGAWSTEQIQKKWTIWSNT